MKIPRALCLLSSLLLTVPCSAAPEAKRKLSPEDAAQLQRDKVIITSKTYRQVFQPYVFSNEPVFITSDSLLNGWFVLLGETVAELEGRFAAQLPGELDKALESIKDPPKGMSPELFEKAARHARIIAGTAAKLSGGKWRGGEELDRLIAAEVTRVETATGLYLPSWLKQEGTDIAALDYSVFKPVSFYTRSPRMERYFRAVRWMQSIPFRPDRDEDLAAFALLESGLTKTRTLFNISSAQEFLGGPPADVDGRMFRNELYGNIPDDFDLGFWRETAAGLLQPSKSGHGMKRRLVLLSARAPPDADLFHITTSPKRPLPSGLDAGAALGSGLAGELLAKHAGPDVLQSVEEWRTIERGNDTLYSLCFDNLGLLMAPPEPEAPAFMNSDAWRRKSLNTALGGWAQLRHTWALQGKENIIVTGMGDSSPGFVEPNPEFFRHIGLLVRIAMDEFGKLDALEVSAAMLEMRAREILPELEKQVSHLKERLSKLEKKYKERQKLTDEEKETATKEIAEAMTLPPALLDALKPLANVLKGFRVDYPQNVESIQDPDETLTSLRDIAGGKQTVVIMESLQASHDTTLRARWVELLEICHRLETLAHKQLRGVEPAKDEVSFIENYGPWLAGVMFYDGTSWETQPHDDAPRIASVFNQPGVAHLLAGVGRPREIRVLYPWKGKEIECRGAVMPYYEFTSARHLTDTEWKERLDAKDAPPLPGWLKPVTGVEMEEGK